MESEECETCPLFMHIRDTKPPVGTELAWAVHRKLNRSAVERFGLQREAWGALGLELEADQLDGLLDQLSACEDGLRDAQAEIDEKRRRDNEAKRR